MASKLKCTHRFLQSAAEVEPVPGQDIHRQVLHPDHPILYPLHPQSNNLQLRTQCTLTLAKAEHNAIKPKIHQGNLNYLVSPLNKRIEVNSDADAICQPIDLRIQLTAKNQPKARLGSQLTR